MKWALLAVAAASLWVCWALGQPLFIRAESVNSAAGVIAFAMASPTYTGIIMAGLVGTVAVIGATKIQISENKTQAAGQ